MAGIKNIRDLYKKVGEKGLREVLSGEIRVTEKFDAYRFAFEKNPHDYKIYFYGKNGKTPLSKIDRTVNDLYEAAISYIENLPADIKKAIPPRHRFGFSWFPSNKPLSTEYDRRPKKGLLLTDITIRNRENDITRDVHESQVFERWANVLGIEAAVPVFEGQLDHMTIDSLVSMAQHNYALDALNESAIHTHGQLNEKASSIEALIFQSDAELFKVASTEEKPEKSEKRSHLFDILLLDICEHLNNFNLGGIKVVSMHADEAYIEVVSEAFNDFVEKRGADFLQSGLSRPSFLEKSGKFNRTWVKNPKTIAIIESHQAYEYLYTVFLTNLKKPKYLSGLLSEAVVNTFNSQIEEINHICEGNYSFLEFSTIIRENLLLEDAPVLAKNVKANKKEEDPLPDVEKSVLLLHSFFNHTGNSKEKDLVDVLVVNGGLPTNRIIVEANRLQTESGLKVVLIHNPQQDKLAIEDSAVEKMLSLMVDENRDLLDSYSILPMPTLRSILLACGSAYPRKISCSPNLAEVLQMEMLSHLAACGSNAKPFKIDAHGERMYKDCLDSLKSNEISAFKKCMPTYIHSYWSSLKSAYDKQTYY